MNDFEVRVQTGNRMREGEKDRTGRLLGKASERVNVVNER
jgi:hypothetical protein